MTLILELNSTPHSILKFKLPLRPRLIREYIGLAIGLKWPVTIRSRYLAVKHIIRGPISSTTRWWTNRGGSRNQARSDNDGYKIINVQRMNLLAERCQPPFDFGLESARWMFRRPGCCQLTPFRSFSSSFSSNMVLVRSCRAFTISSRTKEGKSMKVRFKLIR